MSPSGALGVLPVPPPTSPSPGPSRYTGMNAPLTVGKALLGSLLSKAVSSLLRVYHVNSIGSVHDRRKVPEGLFVQDGHSLLVISSSIGKQLCNQAIATS